MKLIRSGLLIIVPFALLLPFGCEIDSADTFSRDVSTDFTGFYSACENDTAIVQQNSGNRIRTLDLRQSGDTLEAVDNNGAIWRGTLGDVQNGRSSFQLKGRTSTGVEGIFSGTLSSSDGGSTNSSGSANGTMTGTYIEPDRFSTFCGTATIPGSKSNDDDGNNGGSTNVITNTVSNIVQSGRIERSGHSMLTLGAFRQSFLRALETVDS